MAAVANNPDALTAALRRADAGAVVMLGGGTWPAFGLKGITKRGPPVVITPQPGAKVTLTNMTVSGCEGLTFRGVRFVIPRGDPAVRIKPVGLVIGRSKRITLDGCDFSGDLAAPASMNAVWVRSSEDATVRRCRFHDVYQGIFHDANTRLTVDGNLFRDLHSDGIRGGHSSDGVTIRGNDFADSHQTGDDHLDCIQFWTTNATKPSTNILVENNVYRRGKGDPCQFLLIGDQTNQGWPSVVIRGNGAVGGAYNGIVIKGADNPLIEDNYIQAMEGASDAKGRAINKNWIQTRESTGGMIRDNFTNAVSPYKNLKDPDVKNNRIIPIAKAGDYSGLDAWLRRKGASAAAETEVLTIAGRTYDGFARHPSPA